MIKKNLILLLFVIFSFQTFGQHQQGKEFNGLFVNRSNLFLLSDAKTRSISPENPMGEKGKGGMATLSPGNTTAPSRELGQGWKVRPMIGIGPGQTDTIANIEGPGAIQHIWLTPTGNWRYMIIRFYWDGEKTPSVEVPLGDFFCMGWGKYAPVVSDVVCVNPGRAFNCYWVMPFRKRGMITIENIDTEWVSLFYQIDYTLTDVPENAGYFHAQFRRSNPTQGGIDTLVSGIKGEGQYVGTYLGWEVRNNGWWGEGEIKFYIDGDTKFPTINGTGTEDYFCGSFDFDTEHKMPDGSVSTEYTEYNTPYAGMPQVIRGDGHYNVMQRFGLYRWHIPDPIRFEKDLTVTIQDLGWKSEGRFHKQHSDISSVVYWYQKEPHAPFPKLPSKDELEVIN